MEGELFGVKIKNNRQKKSVDCFLIPFRVLLPLGGRGLG
jgi:hypothetical protein